MSPSRSGHRKPRSYYAAMLNAARNGSVNDVQALTADLEDVPGDLLQDVLGMFLSHLDVRKFAAYKEDPALRNRYDLALTSLKGLLHFVELKKFLSYLSIGKSLLDSWRSILDCTRLFHADALDEGNDGFASLIAEYFVRIFHGVTVVDFGQPLFLFGDPELQDFISQLWLRISEGEEVSSKCSKLLVFGLNYPGGMQRLLQAVRTGNPSDTIAKIAVDRLKYLLAISYKKATKPFATISISCFILVCISESHEQGVTQALVNSGGITLVLRALQLCREASSSGRISEDPSILTVAVACFKFLSFCFRDINSNLLGKILRGGMLDVLFELSPYVEQMEASLPGALPGLQYILDISIPQELIYSKSINRLTNAIKSMTAEQKQRMSKSILSVSWNELEALCIERLAMSEVSATLRRSSRCDMCKKWDLKSQLKACGSCRRAIYCSRACQIKDWKSSVKAHKDNCTPYVMEAALTKPIRITDITADLASRDVSRYFENIRKAESDFLGSFLPERFHPLNNVIVLNYLTKPLDIEILNLREVLTEYRDIPGNADFWTGQVIDTKGKGVLCLRFFKGPAGRIHCLSLVDLGTIWATVPPHSPRQWKSGLPSAIGRRGHFDKWQLKRKIDALEDILSHCGSTLDEFSKSDFSERIDAWLKVSVQLARK